MGTGVTAGQLQFFRDNGYLLLKGAIARKISGSVRLHVFNELKKLNIWSSGKTLSKRMHGIPAFQQITKLGQLIKYPGLQDSMVRSDLLANMETLAGSRLVPAQDAQLLLSLPNQGDWTLARLDWHVDISSSWPDKSPGIQVFALLDDLAPQGGATLALAGSHRLARSKSTVREFQKNLRHGSAREMTIDGIELSVVEMTGQAGDVYLMDMRLLHTPSINATKRPRMMATARYFTRQ